MDPLERAQLHRLVVSQGDPTVQVWSDVKQEWRSVGASELDSAGVLNIALYAQLARDDGFPAASGGCAFVMLAAHAALNGTVSAICGSWYPSSDNFKKFRELVADGWSDADAASETFTGQQAALVGFPVVTIVEDRGHVVTARFEPRRRDDG